MRLDIGSTERKFITMPLEGNVQTESKRGEMREMLRNLPEHTKEN